MNSESQINVYEFGKGPQIPAGFFSGNRLCVFLPNMEALEASMGASAFSDILSYSLDGNTFSDTPFWVYSFEEATKEIFCIRSPQSFDWLRKIPDKLGVYRGIEPIYLVGVGVNMHLQPWLSACAFGRKKIIFQDLVDVVNAFLPVSLVTRKKFRPDMFAAYAKHLGLSENSLDDYQIIGGTRSRAEVSYVTAVKSWVNAYNPKRETLKYF